MKNRNRMVWLRKELDFDLSQWGWLTYDQMETTTSHRRHLTADICEGENRHLVSRLLGESFAVVAMALKNVATVIVSGSGGKTTDTLKEPARYELRLKCDSRGRGLLSEAAVLQIVARAHTYMVSRVLATWLAALMPAQAAIKQQEAADALTAIQQLAATATTTTRRPLSPF